MASEFEIGMRMSLGAGKRLTSPDGCRMVQVLLSRLELAAICRTGCVQNANGEKKKEGSTSFGIPASCLNERLD